MNVVCRYKDRIIIFIARPRKGNTMENMKYSLEKREQVAQ